MFLNTVISKRHFPLTRLNPKQLANLSGPKGRNLRVIEDTLAVRITLAKDSVHISGTSSHSIVKTNACVQHLSHHCDSEIGAEQVQFLLHHGEPMNDFKSSAKLNRKIISARNQKQQTYIDSINHNVVTIAEGPAGTGKTWLAVAKAIECFEKGEVQRLIFVRPAVEAGEKLGFLPGDLVEKVLPYLRPVYDALYEMIGFKETQKLIQSDVIEILPLAFMRGRTLNEAFIILDEAQNATKMQMKMFLTRMGFSSYMVINGDMSQTDLPIGTQSGLSHVTRILDGVEGIGICRFNSSEVVRHPLISKIIERYDNGEDH